MQSEDEEEQRGFLVTRRKTPWAREGAIDNLLFYVPLVTIALLAVGVLVYNFVRSQWEPCDEEQPLAKHFYCHNKSLPPGFHLDTPAG